MSEPPFAPIGAPLRPGQFDGFSAVPLFALVSLAGTMHPIFGALGIAGLVVASSLIFVRRRRFDRIGWYERREVEVPALPFEMRGQGQRILFNVQSITFSGFLMPTRTLNYTQIVEVQNRCEGHCLEGITIYRTNRACFTESHRIFDSGNGERTRVALALLRMHAPDATFTGPKWVEEGWVPRLGFLHPSSSSGSGGP